MNYYILGLILSYSVLFAAIAGVIRFKYILRDFYPFLFVIFLGAINELISTIRVYNTGSNAINGNVYVLVEYLLIMYQFFKWDLFRRYFFFILAAAGLLVWLTDNFMINSIVQNNSLFRTFYSIVIVVLSTNELSKLLVYVRGPLIKNATFLICITFLFYYGCKAFVEAFNAFHIGFSRNLLLNLWIILYFVNAIANLLYAIAILWIPRKREFILPY